MTPLPSMRTLESGDLMMTGTSAGMGIVVGGDQLVGRGEGLDPAAVTIV
jgi:2-keto-4-pentenoate hydratase/2-oxohepta-3-ene-1,7-dioic acid hydratase in catechol pathway